MSKQKKRKKTIVEIAEESKKNDLSFEEVLDLIKEKNCGGIN